MYHIFVEKFHFWNEKNEISHMVSNTWFKLCEMAWFNILSTFIKIKNHLNCFWSIFVFLNTYIGTFICFYKYIPISHIIKWNEIMCFLISCLGYILTWYAKILWNCFKSLKWDRLKTCTPLESSTTWHPKGGHHSVLSSNGGVKPKSFPKTHIHMGHLIPS
jgi:hypothetical protein